MTLYEAIFIRRSAKKYDMTPLDNQVLAEKNLISVLKEKTKQLKYNLSALYLAYKRKDVPMYAKVIPLITIGYALSPIDLIPDFIPVLGYLDDLIILPALITLSIKCIPKPIFLECKEKAKGLWDNGKPIKWYYAIPIVAVWLLIIAVIIKIIIT
ncbi:conserved hypothetical protein [Treponema primitia ZAS-2]|uniref:DUF1232 domain-containing protein n=1 Tax=Treponema primitia (strain ATCC BAA-887 / DSM 12427 / ZAS-2) TaxID=545694 RepID=F5YKA9_TREPZ|nr:YkvA family protein [Treponema primitia]AEF83683.1 conserved hypothetical protein [Treponema primitia ZAS-2]